jgi:putative ABC transport system permease protein
VNNWILYPLPEDIDKQRWHEFGYYAYIRVNQTSNASLLVENFMHFFDIQAATVYGGFYWNVEDNLRLTALPDIHFATDILYDSTPKASKKTLMILFVIAIMIVVIAGINFTNFSAALASVRMKSVNTQHVMGAHWNRIRLILASEAIVISFLSFLVALLLVRLFLDSPFVKLVDTDLSILAHPLIFGGSALVALFVGLLTGIYPSRYMTSFTPALVLNGRFGLSQKGKKMRNILICVQFITSSALIVGASFMYVQNRFMQDSSFGYDIEALVTVDIGQIEKKREAFTNQIKAYSGVKDVTYAQYMLSSSDGYSKWIQKYREGYIFYQFLPVHHTFLKVMGIQITEGRDFSEADSDKYIFNETAHKAFNLELNSSVNNREIIGFISDIKFASFRIAVEPMAFFVEGAEDEYDDEWWPLNIAYIKLTAGTNLRMAMSHIHSTLTEFDANFPFDIRFFDEVLQQTYEKERSLSSLISLFSLIAIFISIVGVFGLVVFDCECRRKEIGIRKIHGSSTAGILIMFNKVYFRILVVCFLIATPLAWYAVNRWLQNFAYKTPMYWWVYLLAFMAVGIITISTVTFQNWRVANENPVKSIE